MTPRKLPSRATRGDWRDHRANGDAHLQAAVERLALLDPEANAKPVASESVLAVIAYGDAITVQRGGRTNAKDHSTLPKLIEQLLGSAEVDQEQIIRLGRILRDQHRAQYGGAQWSQADAERYLTQAKRFINWARRVLVEREG